MKIDGIELFLVELPLVRPFRTSLGTDTVREALLVKVETGDGVGWGECVSGADPSYASEFNEAEWTVLAHFFVPALLERADVGGEDVSSLLAGFKGHRMAKAAVEMAVLDAELRIEARSLQDYLGGTGEWVTPGVSVGITDSLEELVSLLDEHRAEGYRRVKLKIEPGWDLAPTRAARELLGEGFPLQVDANTAYRRQHGPHLAGLDEFGLLLLEQPLDEEDLLGHVELGRTLRTPICLDETIVSLRTAAQAIELGACSIVNIKPGRVGGYLEAKAIHDLCREAGIPVWCGGMLETGIGRAANLALATLPGFTLPGDISATARYFREDVTEPFLLEGGAIKVPTGPGIGVDVSTERVERLSVRRERFTPSCRRPTGRHH